MANGVGNLGQASTHGTGFGGSPARQRTEFSRIVVQFRRNRLAVLAGCILLALVVLALLAPTVNKHVLQTTPEQIDVTNRLVGNSWTHPLGTDELGRDVLARLLVGSRLSLLIGVLVMVVSTVIGITVGGMAGHFGGAVDNLLMRFTDTLLATPTFYILLAMSAYAGNLSVVGIVLIIAATSWMSTARIMRAEFLSIRENEYVVAARAVGAGDWQIIRKHILPNVMPTAIVAGTLGVGYAILTESSLSFLGLGVQPPDASWGTMLRNAQFYVWRKPMLAVYPGVFIMVAVLCFNFLGDGLREALDPRLSDR